MIQRIQTIWLVLAAVLTILLIKNGFVQFTGANSELYLIGFSGITLLKDSGSEILRHSVVIPVTMVVIPVLSAVAIFLFKNRSLQKSITLLVIAFSICLCIIIINYWAVIVSKHDAHIDPGLRTGLPLLILISSVLAYHGISRDEKLVKSYDRLR